MGPTRTKVDRLGLEKDGSVGVLCHRGRSRRIGDGGYGSLALGFALLVSPAIAQVGTNSPFYPTPLSTQSIAATTTSASITFAGTSLNDTELYVYNAGTDAVFCRWGVGAQTATTAGLPIPSGTVQIFNRNNATVFACRTFTTTATVYVTTGNGQ